jgi:CubicO group peptidase (beta-lactamase class C family)
LKKIIFLIMLFTTSFPSLWADDLLTADVLESSKISILVNEIPVARIEPQIYLEGFKEVPLRMDRDDSRFDGVYYFPNDAKVGLTSSVTISGSSIHIHYQLTPLKNVQAFRVRAMVYFPYENWAGATFRWGKQKGAIPLQGSGNPVIAQTETGPFTLESLKPEELSVQMDSHGAFSTLVDGRQWSTDLLFVLNHQEPTDKSWVWKAGETKDFDFTLTFNHAFNPGPFPLVQGDSKGFTGFWYGDGKSASGHKYRVTLFAEKGKNGKPKVYFNNLDIVEGQPHLLMQKVSWKGRDLRMGTGNVTWNLRLNKSRDSFEGTVNLAGTVFPMSLRRGMKYTLPRLDSEGKGVTDYAYQIPQTLLDGWPVGDLMKSPLDPLIVEKGIREILNQGFPNIHGVVLVQGGKLLLDEYFYGYGPQEPHPQMSVVKSYLSILFGIAGDQGLVDAKDKLFDIFPEYRNKPGWDPRKNRVTLGMLLSMTSGFDVKGENQGWTATDQLDYSLNRPLANEPGKVFAYDSTILYLLAGAIVKKSGMTFQDFGMKYLYDPLGIRPANWDNGSGRINVSYGCWLTPRDMAKLGYLYLRKGMWNGKRVVSGKWVEESTRQHATALPGLGEYGYLWWFGKTSSRNREIPFFEAGGLGGQHIFVVPDLDLVCVLSAGNYIDNKSSDPTSDFFNNYVLGAFK